MKKEKILKREIKLIKKNKKLRDSKPLDYYITVYTQLVREISEVIKNNNTKVF